MARHCALLAAACAVFTAASMCSFGAGANPVVDLSGSRIHMRDVEIGRVLNPLPPMRKRTGFLLQRRSTFPRLLELKVPITRQRNATQPLENDLHGKLNLPASRGSGIQRRAVRASVLVKHNIVDQRRIKIPTRLKMLNTSARNSTFILSPICVSFTAEKSKSIKPGP